MDDIIKIMKNKIRQWWNTLLIKKKIALGVGVSFAGIALAVSLSLWLFYSYLGNFSRILEDQNTNQNLNAAFASVQSAFKQYAWNRDDQAVLENYEAAVSAMGEQIALLPTEYGQIGRMRYLQTRSVINGYKGYRGQCALTLQMDPEDPGFIDALYQCYDAAEYEQFYIDRLIRATLQDGNSAYQLQLGKVARLPAVWVALGVMILLCVYFFAKAIIHLGIAPMMRMAEAAREISANHFDIPDIPVTSGDEVGQLIQSFNSMKHATADSIRNLQEKSEMEKDLHEVQMRLLQSQINPHFLFNTLNIISGMARIENAGHTSEMIQRLGNLFRYNLRTKSRTILLMSEVEIAKDYFYIQKHRFGSRIDLCWDIQVKPDMVFLPAFTLQPLLENAIIHGLTPKEEGGRMRIRIFERGGRHYLYVMDSGAGMHRDELLKLRRALETGEGGDFGIGVSNVRSRFMMLYPGSEFKIFSKYGGGTTIRIIW